MVVGTSFHRLLPDDHEARGTNTLQKSKKIKRVVLCSGKVYYDLLDAREAAGIDDVYIMRLEQLHPFPSDALARELAPMAHAEIVWCQEEPRNMGGWTFVNPEIEAVLKDIGAKHDRPVFAGRKAAASTATGLMSRHLKELENFMKAALIDPLEV